MHRHFRAINDLVEIEYCWIIQNDDLKKEDLVDQLINRAALIGILLVHRNHKVIQSMT